MPLLSAPIRRAIVPAFVVAAAVLCTLWGASAGAARSSAGDRAGDAPPPDAQSSNDASDRLGDESPPSPPSTMQSDDRGAGYDDRGTEAKELFNNWNTAACGFTDSAALDVDRPIHLDSIEIWFNWRQGETQVAYSVLQDGREVGSGVLSRASCDPYQGAWCVA